MHSPFLLLRLTLLIVTAVNALAGYVLLFAPNLLQRWYGFQLVDNVHIYLSMGFKPVMNREDMPGRWEAVLNRLKESGREYT